MNQDVKKLWIDALRSGEYDQTQAYLHEINTDGTHSFCCLGVLCDIYQKTVEPKDRVSTYIGCTSSSKKVAGLMIYGLEESLLPSKVVNWAGLESNNPKVCIINDEDEPFRVLLTELNDDAGYTFLKIANIIERQL